MEKIIERGDLMGKILVLMAPDKDDDIYIFVKKMERICDIFPKWDIVWFVVKKEHIREAEMEYDSKSDELIGGSEFKKMRKSFEDWFCKKIVIKNSSVIILRGIYLDWLASKY